MSIALNIEPAIHFDLRGLPHGGSNEAPNNASNKTPSRDSHDKKLDQLHSAFQHKGLQGLRLIKTIPLVGNDPISVLHIWPLRPMDNNQFEAIFSSTATSVNLQPQKFTWIRQEGFAGFHIFGDPKYL